MQHEDWFAPLVIGAAAPPLTGRCREWMFEGDARLVVLGGRGDMLDTLALVRRD
jgi:hypothetical protein